jgi:hypothetical protein
MRTKALELPGIEPGANMLMIKPQYEHFGGKNQFKPDRHAVLPVSELYASALIERGGVRVAFFDRQLHDLAQAKLADYDAFGIAVRGPQSIAVSYETWDLLVKTFGVDPKRIYFGGQGIEPLDEEEFQVLFPGSVLVKRNTDIEDYWELSFAEFLDRFDDEDMRVYLNNELTLPFSQGCMYGCKFCAAQVQQSETFYNTRDNLDGFLRKASALGIKKLSYYATSLDFFQQAKKAPGHDITRLTARLQDMIDVQSKYGVQVSARVLSRIDSLNDAMEHADLMDLFQQAGFGKVGFGVDGIASQRIWEQTGKGYLRSAGEPQLQLLKAYESLSKRGITPENLYVFGHDGLDTAASLDAFERLSVSLMDAFPNSVYRGFVAKQVAGSSYWQYFRRFNADNYLKLLQEPWRFMNKGYEMLANPLTHPNREARKIINYTGVKVSYEAHKRKQLQGSHTLPLADDGTDVLDEQGYALFMQTTSEYLPASLRASSLRDYAECSAEINRYLPRDT